MSAKPETTFLGGVNKHLPESVYHMKNHNPYVGGVPDVWYSGSGGDLWVEYKFIVMPKRGETVIKIDLSKLQQTWLSQRHAEGRNVAVIVGHKDGGVWMPGMDWGQKYTAFDFFRLSKSRKDLASIIEGSVR
jgi:hypothetical protein